MLQTLFKQAYEERLFQFDFSDDIGDATIASVVSVTATSLGHVTGSVPVTVANITYSSSVVQALFSNGTTGETYKMVARVTDSAGQRLELDGFLRVQDE